MSRESRDEAGLALAEVVRVLHRTQFIDPASWPEWASKALWDFEWAVYAHEQEQAEQLGLPIMLQDQAE